jgi:hypothetical protein
VVDVYLGSTRISDAGGVALSNGTWSWTPSLAAGTYDVVLKVRDGAGNVTQQNAADNRAITLYALDDSPPEVTLPTFAAPFVGGNLNLFGAGALFVDADSGIASSALYYWNGSAWALIAPADYASGTARWNSSVVADGSVLLFKGTATNGVGVSTTVEQSATGTGAITTKVDNSVATASWVSPTAGAWVPATSTLKASVADTVSGVTSVAFRYQQVSTGTWSDAGAMTLLAAPIYQFAWTNSLTGAYNLAAVATNGAGLVVTSTVAVSIDSTLPTGSLTISPAIAGSVWQAGTVKPITWTLTSLVEANPIATPILIEAKSDGVDWFTVATVANTGSYNWTVAALSGNACQLRVSYKDVAGNTLGPSESGPFTIWSTDAVAPTVAVAAAPVQVDGNLVATATGTAGLSGIQGIGFSYRLHVTVPPVNPWGVSVVDQNAPYTHSWSGIGDGIYDVRAVITNGVGVTASSILEGVIVDTAIEDVSITSPGSGVMVAGVVPVAATVTNERAPGAVGFWYQYQSALTAAGPWTLIVTDTVAPAWTANWDTSGLANGSYKLKAIAVVGSGATLLTGYDEIEVTVDNRLDSVNVELLAGWNLISTPLIPNNKAITTVLADLIANDSIVLATTFTGGGQSPTESRWQPPVNQLTTIEDGKGYWVKMSQADTLKVYGKSLPTPPAIPPSYQVLMGWNLIGFKSEQTDMSVQTYLGGADNAKLVRAMYSYDAASGVYQGITDAGSTKMEVGAGYWLALSDGFIIYPPAN